MGLKSLRFQEKTTSYRTGLRAETIAAAILFFKGYRILARRYKTPAGEIDLVARRGRTLAFVEVKARSTLNAAIESVTDRMKHRIAQAGRFYLSSHQNDATCETIRFDLIALAPPLSWTHKRNAWEGGF